MKHYFTWLQILGKRLLRKPLFLFTLFLIPATVLLLRGSIHPKDSAIHVLLYSEESAGKQTQDTIHDLLAQSNTIVTFPDVTKRRSYTNRFYLAKLTVVIYFQKI